MEKVRLVCHLKLKHVPLWYLSIIEEHLETVICWDANVLSQDEWGSQLKQEIMMAKSVVNKLEAWHFLGWGRYSSSNIWWGLKAHQVPWNQTLKTSLLFWQCLLWVRELKHITPSLLKLQYYCHSKLTANYINVVCEAYFLAEENSNGYSLSNIFQKYFLSCIAVAWQWLIPELPIAPSVPPPFTGLFWTPC